MIYVFGECELDTSRHVLRRAGEEQKLEPQAFDVLEYLLANAGRTVAKEEMLDQIWGDRFVGESALTSRIKSARRAVGDDGKAQRIIRTVHGRGYELVAAVSEAEQPRVEHLAPVTADVSRSELRRPTHDLVGREVLLPRLVEELQSSRLLTLVGPAGVGKTSVALALAALVDDVYPDGVWLVELARVTSPDAAIHVLATTLDMKSQQDRSLDASIVEMLAPRRALLILDNCEHVVEPVSEIVESILHGAPEVRIIATSREPLAIPREQLWPVDPLPVVVDDGAIIDATRLADNPSVELFVARAHAADPHFVLTDSNARAVAEICRRLDGIPLAIELAAARQRSLDVHDLADRLSERFRLLKAVRRGSEERHQTLQSAVRWSYDLLSPDERRVFDSLSVFAGPFSLESAEAVLGDHDGEEIDVLDALGRLVERSMLTLGRTDGGRSRFEMLETMREFGRERLGDSERLELHRRHGVHFLDLARRIADGLKTADERQWVDAAHQAFPDFRAAQLFASEVEDPDTTLGIIDGLSEYAMRTLRYEVLAWIAPALALPGADTHALHAQMVALQAYGAWVRGEYALARTLAETALAEIEDRELTPSTTPYRVLGNVGYQLGEGDVGFGQTARMLEVATELRDPSRITHAAYMHSVAASSQGKLEHAQGLLDIASASSMETNCPTDLASVAVSRAFVMQDNDEAIAACHRAVELAEQAGNRWISAFARTELCGRLLSRGDVRAACVGLSQVVETWHRSGDWSSLWLTLTHSAMALQEIGDDAVAAQVIGATDHHASFAATPMSAPLRESARAAAEVLRTRLGAEEYEALMASGAALPLAEVVHRTGTALVAGAAT